MASIPRQTGHGTARLMGLVALLGLAILLTFVDRGAIGVGAPVMMQELNLTGTVFGLAVSAFFLAYAPMCLLIGWAADRACVYRLFSAGVALWAVATFLTGWVGGVFSLVVLRLLLGLGESVAFPGSSKIIAAQVPAANRGMANAVVACAIAIGPAMGTLAGGAILTLAGWRPMFWIFGAATLLWLVPWLILTRPYRAAHNGMEAAKAPLGFKALLRIPALWKMGIAHFTSNYCFYVLVTWLPLYLVKSRGFSLGEMTIIASVGFLVQGVVSLISGRWSDWLVERGASEDTVRRSILVGSQLLAAIAIGGVTLTTSREALVAFLIIGGIGSAGVAVNIFAVGQIFAGPRMAGTWMGVQSTIANLAGIIAPAFTGWLIDHAGFEAAFLSGALVAGAGAVWWWLAIPRIEQVVD